MPLLLLMVCLALIQSGVFALALGTTTTSLAPVPTTSSIPFLNLVATSDPPSATCESIRNCRTLLGIIWSCLGTIFACIWVAVHRNIPGPKQKPFSVHLEWFKVVFLTLLVPEWILAWAVRQNLYARRLAKELEGARVDSQKERDGNHKSPAVNTRESDGNASDEGEEESEIGSVGGGSDDEIPLTRRQPSAIGTSDPDKTDGEALGTCESIVLDSLLHMSHVE